MKYLLLFFLVFYSLSAQAQNRVGFSFGGNFSQIRFINSDDVVNKDLKGLPGTTATFFYQHDISNKKKQKHAASNLAGFELGYKSNRLQNNASNLLTVWNMHYLTGSLTFRHNSNSKHKASPFYGGGLVVDYLMSGTQNRGFNQFDITEDLKPLNVSLTLETGLMYHISDEANASLRLAYLRGLANLEKDPGQQAYIHAWRLSIAVFFNLKKNNRKRKK